MQEANFESQPIDLRAEILFEQVKKLNSFLITWRLCEQQQNMLQRQCKSGQEQP